MNKADTQSGEMHNAEYKETFNLDNADKAVVELKESTKSYFKEKGFEQIVKNISPEVKTHIDIGCGTGWLLLNTSAYFDTLIGIDPAEDGINAAKKVTKDIPRIHYIQKDMISAIEEALALSSGPVFLTTAVVLSHIRDSYVKEFLLKMKTLPDNSVFFFDEPYGTNIQQNMWHIRSEAWWANILEEWDVQFINRQDSYKNGIYGKKVGKNNRTHIYGMSIDESIDWFIDGLSNKAKGFLRWLKRKITK